MLAGQLIAPVTSDMRKRQKFTLGNKMADTQSTKNESSEGGFSLLSLFRRPEAGAAAGFVLIFLFFSFFGWDKNFLTPLGASTWLNFASKVGIIAIPIGFLMIAGELDISVGAVIPAGGIVLAMAVEIFGFNFWVAVLFSFAVAAAIGWINGMLVTRTQVPSLIVTLATLFVVAGLNAYVSKQIAGTTQHSLPDVGAISEFLMGDYHSLVIGEGESAFTIFRSLQSSFFIWIVVAVMCFYILHVSPWGNWIFAMGGDQESARNAGIPTNRLKIALFMLSAMAAALVGMTEAVLANTASTTTQFGMIFNTIICVVVGGVLLTGGFGTVTGVVFGTLTFGIVFQGINFTTFDKDLNMLFIGALLLIAVLMNDTFRNLATSASTSKKK
ncbi:monosaccharide ABC transporter membrane protein, CUT2 family [Thalassococcus halodurans]|uniref:Xylose transport system permease protein XylH n=1 Tax=Thalassococcus halodurans TaxID=373675 RepID=A0A1H6A1I8_9RHOB|nr:monosaccharide ABC transporter membrane protein, CUT2 family [Thalassococcus halodurans]